MKFKSSAAGAAALLVASTLFYGFRTDGRPEDALVGVVKTFLAMGQPADWTDIDALPHIKWAALPPASLQNCLPNGDCSSRQGVGTLGDRTVSVVATGARTMVFHILVRNAAAPLGETVVLAALRAAELPPLQANQASLYSEQCADV